MSLDIMKSWGDDVLTMLDVLMNLLLIKKTCNPNCKGPRKLFELHDFRIIGVFYKSLLSQGPTDPFDLNDFLNYKSYMGSTV